MTSSGGGVIYSMLLGVQGNAIAVDTVELAGPTALITVEGSGRMLGPALVNVFDAVPGIFTLDGSGMGQAAVLNQDGTVNSPSNPAALRSVISVFMTGAGRMSPPEPDGSLGPLVPPFPIPLSPVSSSLGSVLYAGAAPGLIAGAVQVNIRIANTAQTGDQVPLLISVGEYSSADLEGGNPTIAIH